jgi:hypothetical protein
MLKGHDPTLFGWMTTAAYVAAALLAWAAARTKARDRQNDHWRAAVFWASTAAFMALLALNKQLDLQTFLTDLLRREARTGGWYGQRRAYQLLFIQAMGLIGLVAGGAVFWWVRRERAAVKAGAVGVLLSAAFIVVRAASFHHHDVLGRVHVAGFRAHMVLEWSCIAIVAIAAAMELRHAVYDGDGATVKR